jgi:hypothetical protein
MTGMSGTGRIADDLYLLAHHEVTGKPHLQPRAAGLGLAGGLLAELMLAGSISLHAGRIVTTGRAAPHDGLARSVLRLAENEPAPHAARDWLVFLGRTAAGDIAKRLEHSGYLTPAASRRPRRTHRWAPADPPSAFAPVLRVASALDPARRAAAQNVALAGLAVACGLGPKLALYLPDGALRRIQLATRHLHPGLRGLLAHTQATVDSALLSHRV